MDVVAIRPFTILTSKRAQKSADSGLQYVDPGSRLDISLLAPDVAASMMARGDVVAAEAP